MKKHKRDNYPGKYVIYILTTEDHKKNRLYIIGKANELKNRIGSYNKTAEHEVIYYKSCNNEYEIELMVLNNYREKANRDRFILPVEKDINFIYNICIKIFLFIIFLYRFFRYFLASQKW